MKSLLVSALLCLSAVSAANWSWSYCKSPQKIDIKTLTVSPDPIKIPGTPNLKLDAQITKEVKSPRLSIKLVRHTFLEITLPCVENIGSCSYSDVCSALDKMEQEDWATVGKKISARAKQIPVINKLVAECKAGVVKPQQIKVDETATIQKLPSILSFIAGGDYTATIEITENVDNSNILCLEVKSKISNGGGGFWGKRRRR